MVWFGGTGRIVHRRNQTKPNWFYMQNVSTHDHLLSALLVGSSSNELYDLRRLLLPPKDCNWSSLGWADFPSPSQRVMGLLAVKGGRIHYTPLLCLITCVTPVKYYASDRLIVCFQSEDAAKSIHPTSISDGKGWFPYMGRMLVFHFVMG